jgi:hypothetical protein
VADYTFRNKIPFVTKDDALASIRKGRNLVPQYQTLDQLTEKCVVEDRRGQADDFAAAHFLVTEKISPELFPVNREKYREIAPFRRWSCSQLFVPQMKEIELLSGKDLAMIEPGNIRTILTLLSSPGQDFLNAPALFLGEFYSGIERSELIPAFLRSS